MKNLLTISALGLVLLAFQASAIDAVEIGEMFKKDRTDATKQYKGKELSVRAWDLAD